MQDWWILNIEMKYFPIARVNEVGHRREEPKDPNEQGEGGIIFVKKDLKENAKTPMQTSFDLLITWLLLDPREPRRLNGFQELGA